MFKKGKNRKTHEELRRAEKEAYYRRRHFEKENYKKIQAHALIHVSEDDAKLQADLDKEPKRQGPHDKSVDLQKLDSHSSKKHHSRSEGLNENVFNHRRHSTTDEVRKDQRMHFKKANNKKERKNGRHHPKLFKERKHWKKAKKGYKKYYY